MAFHEHGEWLSGRDGSQCECWCVPISTVAKFLWYRIPIDSLPAGGQGIGFQFQASASTNREIVGELAGLRESGGTDLFVIAVLASFVLNLELNFANDATLELNLPDIGIGSGANQVA